MSSTAKAKTMKLNSQKVQIKALMDNIARAKQEKRIFLEHSLDTRLVRLQLESRQYQPALALINTLLTKPKRLNDKMILIEVHLLESRVYRGLGNMPKAKPGILHVEEKDYSTAYSYLFEAFENLSALGESEGGSGSGSERGSGGGKALEELKYMLLGKVMLNLPEDVNALLTIKLALRYAFSRDVESMSSVARAHQKRDLLAFQGCYGSIESTRLVGGPSSAVEMRYALLGSCSLHLTFRYASFYIRSLIICYSLFPATQSYFTDADAPLSFHIIIAIAIAELQSDRTIRTHLAVLYDTLFEGNLKKIVEPYSVVEVAYVAEQVGQERQVVETKLSTMIVDKVHYGVLDQGRGCLVIYDEPKADISHLFCLPLLLLLLLFLNTCGAAIETLEQISKVVESLYTKGLELTQLFM
ncbi:hypothetical protein CVT25_010080 [Psilocybe cyanescens]|uniref:PCI domain-containing protein n=1 Tax=Psilocybe cyanescens TaxID=93625 RepID=A0A409XP20_PSICY|nr:hypothetical protein CVT25_010080 [Psilocybe cyanescens]